METISHLFNATKPPHKKDFFFEDSVFIGVGDAGVEPVISGIRPGICDFSGLSICFCVRFWICGVVLAIFQSAILAILLKYLLMKNHYQRTKRAAAG